MYHTGTRARAHWYGPLGILALERETIGDKVHTGSPLDVRVVRRSFTMTVSFPAHRFLCSQNVCYRRDTRVRIQPFFYYSVPLRT